MTIKYEIGEVVEVTNGSGENRYNFTYTRNNEVCEYKEIHYLTFEEAQAAMMNLVLDLNYLEENPYD